MKRIMLLLAGVCALGGTVFTTGCGPGLIAAGGGSVGAIFGLQGSDKKKKDNPPPPSSTNVVPAVVVTNLVREESPAAINYTILDANGDTCSVEIEYAIGGGSFATCFEGSTGSEGLTGLSSSAAGSAHVFTWDFASDIGPGLTQNITIRIRANDGTATGSWANLTGQDIGNDAPVVSNIQANGTDVVLFTFDLADQSSDLGSLDVYYSIDQGQNFIQVDTDPLSAGYELIGNAPENLLTSPAGSSGQFIWNSAISLYDYVGDVLIQLKPKDQPSGYNAETLGAALVSLPFPIDNSVNGPPELSLLTNFAGQTFVGQVPFDVTLTDDESDAAIVLVKYSVSGGPFQDCTLVNQFATGIAGPFPATPSPTGYSIVWDALADLNSSATVTDVVLAMVPSDANAGTATLSDPFTVIGNEAPNVTDVQVLQDSGNIPVVITVQDGQADPVSVDIQFSTDGVNYTPLTSADFVFGDPSSLNSSPVGEDNVLIWDTNIRFASTNEASVTLQVTPTDDPPSSAAAALTGTTFTSSAFPIINDAAGSTPVSITVFTTDMAGTPNTNDDVTVAGSGQVYLDRTINPSSAVGFTTFWKIVETGDDYGQLLDVSGGSLSFSTGSITVNDPTMINDQDTFTIDDGLNGPVVFEFDNNFAVTAGNVPVDFSAAATANDVALELENAINASPAVRIKAQTISAGTISLTHEIACQMGDFTGNGGNAQAMAFGGTGSPGAVGAQLNGGGGTQRVLYQAPATPPAGTNFVTLDCAIDAPAYFTTVHKTWKLWWGDKPTSVQLTPTSPNVLTNGQINFSAAVLPATAPQFVAWEVVGTSANGTIGADTGIYTAPGSVPAGNPITVRAVCVDPSVSPGTASVTILPEPTSVTVTPPVDNPPNWVNPDLALGTTITFTASVTPAAAPQTVNWRIIWNAQDWGSGNSTVGTIDNAGNYTAPSTLPSPDLVTIQAVSTAKSSVYGGFTVHLKAPPPTSFIVSPSTATVFAGGAGRQFTVGSFVPANANQSVTWELNPVVGNISASGFYSPPATSPTQQAITVTARSAVAPTVTSTAIITLNPQAATPPSSVTISPNEGITISATQSTQSIQFTSSVLPTSASQAVTWSFVGAPFGTITQSGLYTPGATATDVTVTLRCQANASPNPFATVDVCITGDGTNWGEGPNMLMGRGDASAVYDGYNDRIWYVGGHNETYPSDHTDTCLYLDVTGAPAWGQYLNIGGTSGLSKSPNCLMCVYDESNERLIAVLGLGPATRVDVYTLDLTKVDPPSNPPEPWQKLNYGGAANAPVLGGNFGHHTWYDKYAKQLQLMEANDEVYILDCDSGHATFNQWIPKIGLQNTSLGPTNPERCGHAFDVGNNLHYFVGAANQSGSAANRVWTVDSSTWKWTLRPSTGTNPSSGLVNPSVYYHNGFIQVFGGRESNKASYSSALYEVDVSSGASWTMISPTGTERPLPRGDAGFTMTPSGDAYLYGGELQGVGTFGDLWYYDETTHDFYPENPDDFQPQGRSNASGTWADTEGLAYGGVCDHGVDNGLWRVTYGGGQAFWQRVEAFGDRPPPLWGSGMCYNSNDFVMLMFGGNHAPPGNTPDIDDHCWSFDPTTDTWTDLGTMGPGKRTGMSVCYDLPNKLVWFFGGLDDNGNLMNDLWTFDYSSNNWSQRSATGSLPDPRVGATMGFDTRQGRLLMLGGDSSVSGPNRQLHEFSLASGKWTALSVNNSGNAENVNLTGGIYDDACSRFLHLPTQRKKAQAVVMATNGATWQYLTPPGQNNTSGGTGLYDPTTGRYYCVFGERTISGSSIGTNEVRTFVLQ